MECWMPPIGDAFLCCFASTMMTGVCMWFVTMISVWKGLTSRMFSQWRWEPDKPMMAHAWWDSTVTKVFKDCLIKSCRNLLDGCKSSGLRQAANLRKWNPYSASHWGASLIFAPPPEKDAHFWVSAKHLKSCNGGSETAGDPYVYLCSNGNGALEALVTLLDTCLAIQF